MSESIYPPGKAWGLKPHLSLDESILIGLGYDPKVDFEALPPTIKSEFHALSDVLKREISDGVVWSSLDMDNANSIFNDQNAWIFKGRDGKVNDALIESAVIAQWFKDKGYSWPFDESGNPVNQTTQTQSKDIDTRQKNNYLRVIAALLNMSKTPEKGSEAAIEAQLQLMGFESPKARTISSILSDIKRLEKD